MKMTRHNGRAGKNGVYNPKHNDRQFNVGNSEHDEEDDCDCCDCCQCPFQALMDAADGEIHFIGMM